VKVNVRISLVMMLSGWCWLLVILVLRIVGSIGSMYGDRVVVVPVKSVNSISRIICFLVFCEWVKCY